MVSRLRRGCGAAPLVVTRPAVSPSSGIRSLCSLTAAAAAVKLPAAVKRSSSLTAPWLLLLDRRRRRYEVGLECQRWWCRVIPNSDIATGIYIATRIHIATRIYLATRISRLGYRDSISRISLQTDLRFSAPEDSTALQGRGHSLCRRPCQADSSDFAANKTCSAAAWPSTGFRLGSRQRIKHGVKPGHQKGDGLAGQRIKHGVKLSINGARAPPLSHGADDGEEPAKR